MLPEEQLSENFGYIAIRTFDLQESRNFLPRIGACPHLHAKRIRLGTKLEAYLLKWKKMLGCLVSLRPLRRLRLSDHFKHV